MKKLLGLFLFTAVAAHAAPFSVTDQGTGLIYQCGPGGGGDPNCVPTVSDYCQQNTNYNQDTCFTKASTACASGMNGQCVPNTASYCQENTDMDATTCFDDALASCGGHSGATQHIAEGVKAKAVRELNKK